LRREFPKRRVSFPFFPLTKTTTPASSGGPQLSFHFNDLNPNYHAAAGKRFVVEALKKEEEAGRVATARNSRGKRERTPNKSSETTPAHSPQKKQASQLSRQSAS
jgi:hypothetical protein